MKNQFSHVRVVTGKMELAQKFKETVAFLQWEDTSFESSASLESAKDLLIQVKPDTLIILDWDLGSEEIISLLDQAKKEERLDLNPVMMIAEDSDDQMLGACYEYRIASVHTAEFGVEILADLLKTVAEREQGVAKVREAIEKAHHKLKAGELIEARSDLRDLIDSGADHQHMLLCELAEILIQSQEWDKANELLEPIENDRQWTVRALHLLGRVRMKKGDFPGATQVFDKAKLINPYNVDRLLALGQSLVHQSRFEEAQENFDAAIDIEPDNESAVAASTTCKLVGGDINEALATLRTIKNKRSIASIFNTSAILAMRDKDHAKGMKLYETALKVIGESESEIAARLWFNKGIGYHRQKNKEQAAAAFGRAAELDPEFAKAVEYASKLGGAVVGGAASKVEPSYKDEVEEDVFGSSHGDETSEMDIDSSDELDVNIDDDSDGDIFSLI